MKADTHIGSRPLPAGIQTFSTLRNEGCYYVDKTPLIRELIHRGRHYFLSRPRRFGKSLLVSTLKELFEGNEPLFRGLDIHPHWDWSVRHPVVRLSFGGKVSTPEHVESTVLNQLYDIEVEHDLKSLPPVTSAPERLRSILTRLHQATGRQVVVLIDEYDRPVLNVLEDSEKARANRDGLCDLYSILKDAEEHIRLVFVTGITIFSKTSFSSGLNNLTDISLSPRYATICGYTDHDLDTVFAPELSGLDREKIRTWYNGYHWLGDQKLYNPSDVLQLFAEREFDSYWFDTGETGYLYRLLKAKKITTFGLEKKRVDSKKISRFDAGQIDINALLFQSGYLTITERTQDDDGQIFFTLDYPNFEVQQSLNKGLLEYFVQSDLNVAEQGKGLVGFLGKNDFPALKEQIRSFLAGIPHQWHDSGNPGHHESWYASLLYMCFRTTQVDLKVEESSSHGRSDMVLLHENQVFVLEFKMVKDGTETEEGLDSAITQIREKRYAEKYLDRGEPIHLIGMVFGKKERDLLAIRAEQL